MSDAVRTPLLLSCSFVMLGVADAVLIPLLLPCSFVQDAISFKTDTPVYIAGVGMYGYSSGALGTEQSVNIQLFEAESTELASATGTMTTEGDVPGEILFDEPILIDADTTYSVTAVITTGGSTYYGNGVDTKESDDGIKWNFMHCSKSNNGTGATSGQIPLILYHVVGKAKATEEEAVPEIVVSGDAEKEAAQAAVVDQSLVFLDRAKDLLASVISANASAYAVIPVRACVGVVVLGAPLADA